MTIFFFRWFNSGRLVVLGKDLEIKELSKDYNNKLPFLFKNNFNLYATHLHNCELILVQVNKEDAFVTVFKNGTIS